MNDVTADPPTHGAVPVDLVEEIIDYLGKRPHDEVVRMIARLKASRGLRMTESKADDSTKGQSH